MIRPVAEVLTSLRGRALSRPSFGNPKPLTPLQPASSVIETTPPPASKQNSRRFNFVRSRFILLKSQRYERIDFRRATRRNTTSNQRNKNKPKRDGCIGNRIGWRHAKQQRRHQSRERQRARETNADADQHQLQPIAHHEFDDIDRARPERHSYAHF